MTMKLKINRFEKYRSFCSVFCAQENLFVNKEMNREVKKDRCYKFCTRFSSQILRDHMWVDESTLLVLHFGLHLMSVSLTKSCFLLLWFFFFF